MTTFEKNNPAVQLRSLHKILKKETFPEQEQDNLLEDHSVVHNAMSLGLCMLLAAIMLIASCRLGVTLIVVDYHQNLRKHTIN